MLEKVLVGIDEIQLVPNLPSVIKYLYDHYDIKFILTGSSSYYLKNTFEESMAGRKKIFEVFPLRFGEFLTFRGVEYQQPGAELMASSFSKSEYERLKFHYENYIQYGGFPEVVLSDDVGQKRDLIADIFSSYMNHDIAALADFKKSHEAFKLVKLLAGRIGSKLDVSKLSSLSGISRYGVENYLDLFEQSYLIKTLPVTSKNPDRELVKARKLYFLDNGMASFAADLGSGAKFENAVFNQLHHYGSLSYYALKTGNEIDFVLDKKTAFEVKETAAETDLKNTRMLAQNIDVEACYVIGRHPSNTFEGYLWGGNIL